MISTYLARAIYSTFTIDKLAFANISIWIALLVVAFWSRQYEMWSPCRQLEIPLQQHCWFVTVSLD